MKLLRVAGEISNIFPEIRLESVSLVKVQSCEEFYACLVRVVRRAMTSKSWLYIDYFDNQLTNVWVLFKDPSGGT